MVGHRWRRGDDFDLRRRLRKLLKTSDEERQKSVRMPRFAFIERDQKPEEPKR